MSSTPARSRRKKYEYEKIYGSPEAKLQQLAEESALTQFRAELKRRWPDGSLKGIQTFPSVDATFLISMQNYVEHQPLGGGNFEVYVYSNLQPEKVLFMYGFELEGEPIEVKRMPKFPSGQMPPWAAGQQQQPGVYPPAQGWGPQMQQPGMPPNPWAQQQAWGQNPWMQRPQISHRDTRLESQVEDLKKSNEALQRQLMQQQHDSQIREQQERFDRSMQEIKRSNDEQIRVLKDELKEMRKSDSGDTNQSQLFSMFMKSSENQQNMMQMMMTREADASREQLKVMKEQTLQDIAFRQEMYEKLADSRDPKQAAAMLDLMGQQTASMMNLINQAVTSGLLGGQDGDPAWYRAVSQGLDGLKNLGEKLISAQQQKMAMAGMGRMPQGPTPRLPVPRPGFGQPPQPGAQPRPPAPRQPAAPPQQMPGASEIPEGEVLEAETGEVEQSAPSLLVAIENFMEAMIEDAQDPKPENTRQVGEMVYDFVIFMKSNNMLPPEWQSFFKQPGPTLKTFIDQFVVPSNPSMPPFKAEYMSELDRYLRAIIREESDEGEDEIEDVETVEKPPLQAVPTPPAPPEDEEVEEEEQDDGPAE